MKKHYIAFWLLLPILLFAQENKSTISIRAVSEILIPANVIKFNIHFGQEEKDPQLAFEKHKELEKRLLKIIKKFEIPDTSISYSLISISKSKQKNNTNFFKTSQSVVISLTNFDKYYPFQLALLNNGFYEFNARFSTNRVFEARKQGYKRSLEIAKNNAREIAKSLNRKLGPIINIKTSVNNLEKYGGSSAIRIPSSFVSIKQNIKILTQVMVEFELK